MQRGDYDLPEVPLVDNKGQAWSEASPIAPSGAELDWVGIIIHLEMENSAFFVTIFLWCLLISVTGYSIYLGFGPPSKKLRDPFDEHEE